MDNWRKNQLTLEMLSGTYILSVIKGNFADFGHITFVCLRPFSSIILGDDHVGSHNLYCFFLFESKQVVSTTGLAFSIAADFTVTCTLCYYLNHRRTGFSKCVPISLVYEQAPHLRLPRTLCWEGRTSFSTGWSSLLSISVYWRGKFKLLNPPPPFQHCDWWYFLLSPCVHHTCG